jgi:hypothetical protein
VRFWLGRARKFLACEDASYSCWSPSAGILPAVFRGVEKKEETREVAGAARILSEVVFKIFLRQRAS